MESDTRQEYIKAAISFLQNPKLSDSSLKEKLQFLKDKGLSELEIDEALNLALINRQSNSSSGRWNFFVVLSFCLMSYRFYKAYLEWKQTQPTEQQADSINRNESNDLPLKSHKSNQQSDTPEIDTEHQALNETMSIKEIMLKISELKRLIEYQGTKSASDVQSLKTLLLGHEKFAAPPVIPTWQLDESSKNEKDKEPEKEDQIIKPTEKANSNSSSSKKSSAKTNKSN